MPTYPSSVGGNSRYLQQQILRAGTARMGPVSIEPGDGHIRLNDGTNDTGRLDFNGIQLRYRGAMRGLTALTEDFANLMESHTQTLETNIGRLNGHDADVVRIDAKDTAQDQSLALKAWTSYVDQQDGAASTRMDGIDAKDAAQDDSLSKKAWTSYVDSQNSGQNTRMGNIEESLGTKASITYVDTKASTSTVNAKNSTQDSAISAAQARADAAHSLAASKANVSYVDTKASQAELDSAVARLTAAIRKVAQNTSTPDPFLN